ncbi:glucan endo-1,3-beta-glucosidase, acidic-like [Apium graveolens]|uniref:glucan endo-1,3-beta-glucosidase, acidic-like n=1 Tax=Apium graveolens TaxID=4045 RepID=UPI003D7B5906
MQSFSNMQYCTVLLLLCSFFAFLHDASAAQQASGQQHAELNRAGVCYGTFADNLPSPQEAVSLIQNLQANRIRLYGPDFNVLQALKNTSIEVVLGVPNYQLQSIASGQDKANQWIQNNVQNFPDINFRYIVVGNGVPTQDQHSIEYREFLLTAMKNIQNAVSSCGLQNKIKVSTALDHSVILKQIHPPSNAEFDDKYFIGDIIQLLKNNNAPFLVNIHPYYSYAFNKPEIPLELNKDSQASGDIRLRYAYFRSPSVLVKDGQLGYKNAFDAMVDAVYSALEKADASSLDVVVSETGWPTAGGPQATAYNARLYNNNLIKRIKSKGTPKRPKKPVETYIYNLFDENQRSEMERHWGIFEANKQANYPITFAS